MYEQLFPNAKITYIHLTRGFAQTVNGLMDGWLSPVGFFSRRVYTPNDDVNYPPLNIKGYSDVTEFGTEWWKFDQPYGWRRYIDSTLPEVCLFQWMSAHQALLAKEVPSIRIAFECMIEDPQNAVDRITAHAKLSPMKLADLPVVMATKTPKPMRWQERVAEIMPLAKMTEVGVLMRRLGYQMQSGRWR
jgi:hypothetical protein